MTDLPLVETPPPATTNRLDRLLLLVGGAFIFVNFLALAINRTSSAPTHWVHLAVWAACAVIGQYWLERKLPQRDPLIFPIAIILSGWGLITIDRLAPVFSDRQTLWLVLSVAAMMLITTQPKVLVWLRNYRYTLLIVGLGLLLATITMGQNPSGRAGAPALWLWLGFGSMYFQPSEALKVILVAFLASYLAEQYPALRTERLSSKDRRFRLSPRTIGPILLMWGLSIVILVWQRDLGTAMLFFLVFILLLYVASGSWLILFSGGVLSLLAGFVAYNLFSVVELRIDIWLNPWPEANNRAYQIVQSLIAFAEGGIFGQGVGQGYPSYIPVVHSDFAFAAIAEEWGLLGVITLVALLLTLVIRGLQSALYHPAQSFNYLLAVGLSLLIATQSLMIMGGVLKIVPLTGVTLPFISYGGSSLLISFVIIGLLLRLSSHKDGE